MYRYRIYTEAKNLIKLKRLISNAFSSFTLYHVDGYWEGIREKALVIEILTSNKYEEKANIHSLCYQIKEMNRQESVLVTDEKVSGRSL